jgi:hypothetical protein
VFASPPGRLRGQRVDLDIASLQQESIRRAALGSTVSTHPGLVPPVPRRARPVHDQQEGSISRDGTGSVRSDTPAAVFPSPPREAPQQ